MFNNTDKLLCINLSKYRCSIPITHYEIIHTLLICKPEHTLNRNAISKSHCLKFVYKCLTGNFQIFDTAKSIDQIKTKQIHQENRFVNSLRVNYTVIND